MYIYFMTLLMSIAGLLFFFFFECSGQSEVLVLCLLSGQDVGDAVSWCSFLNEMHDLDFIISKIIFFLSFVSSTNE